MCPFPGAITSQREYIYNAQEHAGELESQACCMEAQTYKVHGDSEILVSTQKTMSRASGNHHKSCTIIEPAKIFNFSQCFKTGWPGSDPPYTLEAAKWRQKPCLALLLWLATVELGKFNMLAL
ncbi:hypothetical protein SERLADRAFT_412205 [Serpula lacrymans var. lacrymans S7.9]|uniref:Uncharacterized protein n=1 Tax=Serpula lacrymans var. lacrymans (strain S7.9) TaxID=578457 RepID=F8PEF8_SERL9|nr:uncharacterized protein SERLADRAFT_412205 [Serpula lacrymans var. lacrymans S7.9]EGO18490.1 hypothetical protein SERLADRAFT_412205 [Serpula lacrymans var. lacrymans S7.9]